MPIPREVVELRHIYQESQIKMINIIATKQARGNVTVYQESILKQINAELASLDQYATTWARDNIGNAYTAGATSAYNDLRRANLALSDIVIDNRRVMLMAENVAMQFVDAHRFVGRQLNDYIRQAGIEAVSQKFATAATVRETQKILIDKLTSHGITGIRDKRGRLIRLDAYAETVARSTTREATNTATLEQLQAHGYDLVKMSSHASPCPICAPLEGRVYSISGEDTRYPPLERAYSGSHANIHPNCLHVLTPYIEKFDDNADQTRHDSNRSFDTDPRSKAQQDAYNAAQRRNTILRNDRNQWERYRATMPDQTPKTFSAFRRMKTSNSANWQKLQNNYRATRAGKPLTETAKKVTTPPKTKFAKKVQTEINKGIATEQDVIRVGKVVGDEAESRIEREIAKMRSEGEVGIRKLLEVEHKAKDEFLLLNTEDSKLKLKQAINARLEAIDALEKKVRTVRARVVKDTLSEIRPMGTVGLEPQVFASGSRKAAREAITSAQEYLPKDWNAAVNGVPLKATSTNRGYWRSYDNRISVGRIYNNNPLTAQKTAFHEMGHVAQTYNNTGIREVETAFFQRRTAGQPKKWLGQGYKSNEVYRDGQWVSNYMGKVYGSGVNEKLGVELTSMGSEAIYRGSYDLSTDPEYRNFIYGILAAF